MKTLRYLSVFALILALGVSVSSCKKVSDVDLQKAAETVLASIPEASGVTVTVKDKVATISGSVQDENAKSLVETAVKAVKDIKSVVNEAAVVPPAPDFTAINAAIEAGLADALKDHKSVVAAVKDGIVNLKGEIKKADLPTLMQKISALSPAQIVSDSLTVK